jgi:hypothetical protein
MRLFPLIGVNLRKNANRQMLKHQARKTRTLKRTEKPALAAGKIVAIML